MWVWVALGRSVCTRHPLCKSLVDLGVFIFLEYLVGDAQSPFQKTRRAKLIISDPEPFVVLMTPLKTEQTEQGGLGR